MCTVSDLEISYRLYAWCEMYAYCIYMLLNDVTNIGKNCRILLYSWCNVMQGGKQIKVISTLKSRLI